MEVDSFALSAGLFGEADSAAFIQALSSPGRKFMSSVNHLEASIVVETRKGEAGAAALAAFMATAELEVLPFNAAQADIALAVTLDEKLLFKSDDFARTDVACYTA